MKIHIVQRGDTLWSIAEKYNVSFEEVKQMNAHLANPDMIVPGMKIKLPETAKQMEKVHPFTDKKPLPCPPEMKGLQEEEMKETEFTLPEQWMTEPAPMPGPYPFSEAPSNPFLPKVEHDMMIPSPGMPVPCFFYPVPFPMSYMMPCMPEMEEEEKAEKQEMGHYGQMPAFPIMPKCPYCHR